jgi:hypothetical protein
VPYASVCDAVKVVGTGTPGKMDALERPTEQLKRFPNPAQGDGRTGTWSWYPRDVAVEIVDTVGADANPTRALHFTGAGLNRWTGVSLAFLGYTGGGTCYDGTAYRGIKFNIKGTVNAVGYFDKKITLGVATAETKSIKTGGDLDGDGGHFFEEITLTGEWQTVTVYFSSLNNPTWGDTQNLLNLAEGKLQMVDWEVSDTTTDFDLLIDDIELI